MSSVEDLPDFSTWKMINDTFPALVKQGYNQSNVERLGLLIKSNHMSKMFFLEGNYSLSHENYTKLADKYNTFTTWILVQICILEHISNTNVRFFSEMGEEYDRGLEVISQLIQTQKAAEVFQIFVTKNDSDCDLNRKLESWVFARTAYTRTLAVMSMIGYILGLGDHRGENIILDSICGDAGHVDFNCLFNKVESFEWPERVLFRVLRTNATTLMSIVTPFVYDPWVSWPRNAGASVNAAERTNEQAVKHIKNIELRLQGIIKTKARSHSIPLSVDGQVYNLINEAMSVDNLCQMYVGWGPYL